MKYNIKKTPRVIIFDFDGTLYNDTKTLIFWEEYYSFLLQKLYERHFGEQEEYKIKYTPEETDKVKKELSKLNINIDLELNKLQDYYQYPMGFWKDEPATVFDNNLIRELSKDYSLYICSDSTIEMIQVNAESLGLDLSCFKQIFVNSFDQKDDSKKIIYNEVMKQEDVSPEEILVIGNSFTSDIKPAEELNFSTILIENSSEIGSFSNDAINKRTASENKI